MKDQGGSGILILDVNYEVVNLVKIYNFHVYHFFI